MCDSDCVEWLKTRAAQYLADAEKAARSPKTKVNVPQLHDRFRSLGWAAGELRDHHEDQQRKAS